MTVRSLVPTRDESRIRMLAFDRLPRRVRDFMNASHADFPPIDVLNHFVQHGEAATLAKLRSSETQAVRAYRSSLEGTIRGAADSFRKGHVSMSSNGRTVVLRSPGT